MGRPPTKPGKLRDGFYIEVRNKGSRTGIKIRRVDHATMLQAVEEYGKTKEVVVMGEYKNGKPVKPAKR